MSQSIAATPTFDVAIIGSGIAGSALACALKDSALSVVLIEAGQFASEVVMPQATIDGFDARVSALSLASEAFLSQLGVWQQISNERAQSYDQMFVWDGEGTADIHFQAQDVHQPHIGHIVENRVIVQALIASLKMSAVTVLDQSPLASIRAIAEGEYRHEIELAAARPLTLKTKLIVGADGANSFVRRDFNMATGEWEYGQDAVVCTIATEKAHANTAWQRFMQSGPLALLPLPGSDSQHFCSIVWSADSARAEALMRLDDASFKKELGEYSEHKLGQITEVSKRFSFPLRQRHALNYIDDGIALVADAAHTIHPLAGQGINLGLLDVKVLADELLRAVDMQHSIADKRVLSRYQRRRKPENLLMMGVMEGFKRLFGEQQLGLTWLRNRGMAAVNRLGPLKRKLMKQAVGL